MSYGSFYTNIFALQYGVYISRNGYAMKLGLATNLILLWIETFKKYKFNGASVHVSCQ